ncbi:hypothetical protein HK100_004465 [Physocladia obscura]|uniref:Nephrocystin 3-like N-terminal domain-containing protein n=1 Tax=Physocladia obscura TaxID=109957 RepID=A0AAD5TAG6_9FUNG|nr:hypothetical protein HK100_004465 [Physocladia obscura]
MVHQATPVTLSIWLVGGEDDDVVEVTINQFLVSELKNEIQVAFDLPNSAFDIIYSYRKDGFVPHKLKPTPNSKLKNILATVADIDHDLRFEIVLHPHKIKIICDGKEPLVLEVEKLEVSKLRNEIERCFPEINNYMLQYDEDGVKTVLSSDSAFEDLHSRELATGSRPTVFVVSIPAKQSRSITNLAHRPTVNNLNSSPNRVLDISQEKRFDVMLSYSWATKQQVKYLYQELMSRFTDLKIWLDEREMDVDIYSSMVEGVVKSDVVITSPNCMREIKFAADLKKPLIPTRMFSDSDDIIQMIESPNMAVPFLITAGLLYIDFKQSLPPSVEWNSAISAIYGQIESRVPRFSCQKISQLADPLQSWLQPVDFSSDIENYGSEYVEGTREWVDNVFSEWQISNEPFLWLCAGAGTGKSLIAYKVSVSPPPNYTLGSMFFCRHNDEQKNSVVKIVSSMAWDLGNRFPEIKVHLQLEMAKDKERTEGGKISILSNPVETFKSLIADGFGTFKTDSQSKRDKNILLIIDALDECDPKTRHNLLAILTHSCKALPDFVKVFATGRPDLDIFESLKAIDPFVLKPTSKENLADVKKFITAKLKNMWSVSDDQIVSNSTMTACVDTLVQKSEGVFIYARNACEFLLKSPDISPNSILTHIHEFESGPDSVYSLILNREYGVANESEIDSFRRVIGTILTVKEPVSIGTLISLGNLTANETGLLRAILKIEHGAVSVIHKSLKDFLSDIKRSGVFFIDTVFINEQLAKSCFEIMNAELSENMAKLDPSEEYHAISGSSSFISDALAYTCIFWVDHFISCSNQELLTPLLLEFCKTKLLNQFEVSIILGKLNSVIFSSSNLLLSIEKMSQNQETLFISEIIQDVKRAAINYRNPLLFNPLQLYKTVLAWLPQKSALYKQYHREGDPFICIGATETWGPLSFEGHTDGVLSVGYKNDGKLIVSASKDKTIKVWNSTTGECVSTIFTDHKSWINQVAISDDDDVVASASSDMTVKVWRIATGECILTLVGHTDIVSSVVIRKQYLVSGALDGTVKVWSLSSGKNLQTLAATTKGISQVKISKNGTNLVSVSKDYMIRIWHLDTGTLETPPLVNGNSNMRCVDYSGNDELLVTGDNVGVVKIWDVAAKICVKILEGHCEEVYSVTFSPDSKSVISGSKDKTIRIWNVATGDCLSSLEGHANWVTSVAFNPLGTSFASASNDMTIKVWPANAETNEKVEKHKNDVTAVFVSLDETLLSSSSTDNYVRLWSIKTGKCLMALKSHTNWVNDVCISSNNLLLASASRDTTVKLWSVESGECLCTFEGHHDYVKTVRFSADSSIIASGSNDRTLKIWSVASGQCLQTFSFHTALVTSVCFSSDNSLVASTSRDRTLKVSSVITGELVRNIELDTKWMKNVEFLDGNKIIMAHTVLQQAGWRSIKKSNDDIKGWFIDNGQPVNLSNVLFEGLNVSGEWILFNQKRVSFLPDFSTGVYHLQGKVVGLARGNLVTAYKFQN